MKLEYIKPEIIELELELEGSFLNDSTGIKISDDKYNGEDDGGWD